MAKRKYKPSEVLAIIDHCNWLLEMAQNQVSAFKLLKGTPEAVLVGGYIKYWEHFAAAMKQSIHLAKQMEYTTEVDNESTLQQSGSDSI